MDLNSLIPSESTFTLAQFEDTVFKLAPCTGGKMIEINKALGSIEELLKQPDAINVSKLAMALMTFESAKTFKKREVITIDLEGTEKTTERGGYKLLADSIAGINEQWGIYSAILQSLGYTKEKAIETTESLKKAFEDAIDEAMESPGVKKKKKKVTKQKK